MKRAFLPIFALVLMLLGGCQADQGALGVYADLQDIYIAAVDQVIELKQADKIDQDTYDNIVLPAIEAGDEVLDRFSAALAAAEASGEPLKDVVLRSLITDLRSVLARLTPYLVE